MTKERRTFSEELNEFDCTCRFDDIYFGEEIRTVKSELRSSRMGRDGENEEDFVVVEDDVVRSVFDRLNPKKAMGPNSICGRLLILCASQLSYVYSKLFTWSLRECVIPYLWKTATVCPVPKKHNPSSQNDYRPIALLQ